MDKLIYLIEFCILLLLQSIIINGIYRAFKLLGLTAYLDKKIKKEWIKKPIFKCIECCSSFWGTIIFYPAVIWAYGFHVWEIPVWVCNIFALVVLNFIIFKKI